MEIKPLVGSNAVFHSALDKAASLLKRNVGTGMEFMQELGKIPGVKKEEIEDRKLHEIMGMPKMTREQFLSALQSRPVPQIRDKFFDEASDVGPHHKQWALSPAELYHELVIKAPKNIEQFPGNPHHFGGEPGILASMLLSFTKDANTKADALHLDELQSDWHQQGREKGYHDPEKLAQAEAKINALKAEHKRLGEVKALAQTPEEREAISEQRLAIMGQIRDATIMPSDHVPDAPFKKNWEEMALKRLLQYAADEVNTDGITISTGKILNDRWGLKKHVDELFYDPDFKTLSGKKNGRSVFYKRDIPSEELEKYIGKDVAQRMLGKKPNEEGLQNLSGLDLEIQNQAMHAFYDKKIPNILNNIGKKYGVKTQLNAFKHVTKPATDTEPEKSVQLHYFPITDEMRKDIRENGLPLYAEGGEVHMAKGGSTIKNIEDYIRQREGEYGLKRLQRAADEIPGLENMYTLQALKEAFGGDNAKALMTMNPADFEKFAVRLFPDPDTREEEMEERIERGHELPPMSHHEYIEHLAKIKGGFADVPFLEVNKRPEYLPNISGHEGRHRSRAMAVKGIQKSLVRLLPSPSMRESMPRRYREDFIEAMKKELGEKRLVTGEGRSLLPADLEAPEHKNIERRNMLGGRPQLPEIYKDGGDVDAESVFFPKSKE